LQSVSYSCCQRFAALLQWRVFQRRKFQTADKDIKYFNVLATFSARH
jgi:hypothetical protein